MRSMRIRSSVLGVGLAAIAALSLAGRVAEALEGCRDLGSGGVRLEGTFFVLFSGVSSIVRQAGPVTFLEIEALVSEWEGDLAGVGISDFSQVVGGPEGHRISHGVTVIELAPDSGLGPGVVVLDFEAARGIVHFRLTGEGGLEGIHGTGCSNRGGGPLTPYVMYVHDAGN